MTRTLRHALFALPVLALASGCGGPNNWFYADIEEPGLCITYPGVVMDPTAPGADMVLDVQVTLPPGGTLFDPSAPGVVIKLISVTFNAKSGIQDFNSVDSATITAIPAAGSTTTTPTELIRYDKAPGFTPGLELTIGGKSDIDLVPFIDSNAVNVEARMVGGLPNNNWTADVTGCLYTRAHFNYLAGYGLKF